MELEFQFNGLKTIINSNKDAKMKEICQKFCMNSNTSLDEVLFLYNGKVLKDELELTIQEVSNKDDDVRNKMSIIVQEIKNEENIIQKEKTKLIKSKNVVCPQCGELGKISIENYTFEISKCKNSHKSSIKVNELSNKLFVDISKIICDDCRIKESEVGQNNFFRCNSCQKNLCSSCKSKHNKEHIIIKHDEKNFICESHNEKYISYCKRCNKNLCKVCLNEHNKLDILDFSNILADNEINNNDLKKNLDNVKENIERIKIRWKIFSAKFQEVIYYFEDYYNFYNHILSNYDINNIRYETLDNIIYLKNSSIIKDIDELNNSNDLKFLNDILNIHYNITTPNINEIIMTYKIKQNKENKINLFGKKFVERNKDNCILDIEGVKMELISEYIYENKQPDDLLIVKLIGINNINDISHMFEDCDSLWVVPSLEYINTFRFNNLSSLFSGCISLQQLPDISGWNTSNVEKFSNMFKKCESLTNIPDLSNWNTWRLTSINSMFYECKSLTSIPDLSKWNTWQITDANYLFYNCSSLNNIQFISKWELPRLFWCKDICKGCKEQLKDYSNFKVTNSLWNAVSYFK